MIGKHAEYKGWGWVLYISWRGTFHIYFAKIWKDSFVRKAFSFSFLFWQLESIIPQKLQTRIQHRPNKDSHWHTLAKK